MKRKEALDEIGMKYNYIDEEDLYSEITCCGSIVETIEGIFDGSIYCNNCGKRIKRDLKGDCVVKS